MNISDAFLGCTIRSIQRFLVELMIQIGHSLKQRVLKTLFGLMMLFIALFIYGPSDAVAHYALIYNLSMEEADALIRQSHH